MAAQVRLPVTSFYSGMNTTPSVPTTDIAQIAKVCHEANRAFCQTLGDTRTKSWEECDLSQRQSMISGVVFRINNPEALPGAQHEAWRQSKIANGWTRGPVKDEVKKEHPNLVPFMQLTLHQQLKDFIFIAIVDAMVVRSEQPVPVSGSMVPRIEPGQANDPSVTIAHPVTSFSPELAGLLRNLGFVSVDDGNSFMYTHKGRGVWVDNIGSSLEIMPIVCEAAEAIGRRTKINEIKQALDLPFEPVATLTNAQPS